MEGKDAEKMDSESPFRLSSGCLFVDVGGLSDDGMLCFRPGIEHTPAGCSSVQKAQRSSISFLWERRPGVSQRNMGGGKTRLTERSIHKGVDLACASGTIVLAGGGRHCCSGTPQPELWQLPAPFSYGGRRNALCSHAVSLCPDGEVVKAGEPIGTVGQTGRATGAHLHLEWLCNGIRYDPAGIFHFL